MIDKTQIFLLYFRDLCYFPICQQLQPITSSKAQNIQGIVKEP